MCYADKYKRPLAPADCMRALVIPMEPSSDLSVADVAHARNRDVRTRTD